MSMVVNPEIPEKECDGKSTIRPPIIRPEKYPTPAEKKFYSSEPFTPSQNDSPLSIAKGSQNAPPKIMVFHPNEEEFKDFPAYIAHMESCGAHKAGIAKVVPPKGYKPRKNGYGDIDGTVIESPILQSVTGKAGVYQQSTKVQPSMTVGGFREMTMKVNSTPLDCSFEDLEKKYWKTVLYAKRTYGSDVSRSLTDKDCKVWNIGNLGTILDVLKEEGGVVIEGVNTPYLYFGAWKTSFCWHTEDMDLYSINYLHFGKPKSWYAIPPEDGKKFETVARRLLPENFEKCPSFLRHKTTLISPKILNDHSIPCDKITQEEGEFIITFPFGYHCGFNHGYNCAESTNFAMHRWIEYGKRASNCSCGVETVLNFNMEVFVKKFQPDIYPLWIANWDRGTHPEDLGGKMFPCGKKNDMVKTKRCQKRRITPTTVSSSALQLHCSSPGPPIKMLRPDCFNNVKESGGHKDKDVISIPEAVKKTPPLSLPHSENKSCLDMTSAATKIVSVPCQNTTCSCLHVPPSDGKYYWQTMNFCSALCVGTYQMQVGGGICSFCRSEIPWSNLGKYCVSLAPDRFHQFCCGECFVAGEKGFGNQYEAINMKVEDIESPTSSPQSCICVACGGFCKAFFKELTLLVLPYASLKACSDICWQNLLKAQHIVFDPIPCSQCSKYVDLDVSAPTHHNYYLTCTPENVHALCSVDCKNRFMLKYRQILTCITCQMEAYNYQMIKYFEPGAGFTYVACTLNCLPCSKQYDQALRRAVVLNKKPAPQTNVADIEGNKSLPQGQQQQQQANKTIPTVHKLTLVEYALRSWRLQFGLQSDPVGLSTSELPNKLKEWVETGTKPNGERYKPDVIFFLCLGVQKYLRDSGRTDNIFYDVNYVPFVNGFTNYVDVVSPSVTVPRLESRHLWECEELGNRTPGVLLFTLIYLFYSCFGLLTLEQQAGLQFERIEVGKRLNADTGQDIMFIRLVGNDRVGVVERPHTPSKCPVRLLKLYISKCDHPHGQLYKTPILSNSSFSDSEAWYSQDDLDQTQMYQMLVRAMMITAGTHL